MKFSKKKLSTFIFLLLFFSRTALAIESVETLKQLAISKHLANDPYWQALGHYRISGVLKNKFRSFIDDRNFFLAEDGQFNPESELLATIDAVHESIIGDEVDQQPVCRFPARYHWLMGKLESEKFSTLFKKNFSHCKNYKEWRGNINAHSVALIYASTHLNSPSSMYGHTLLRIDPPDFEKNDTAFLSWGVSFGANIPPGDNSILYAYKGIFGGYPGLFNVMPYYEKLKEYSRIENRDVWEYPLNLTQAEVDRLVLHLWELKEINFDYFFFDENCSYRLLELLDVARPGTEVMKGYPLVAIPIDTVRGIIKNNFVINANYRPSASTKLKVKIASLSEDEKNISLALSEDITDLKHPDYETLSPERQAAVTQVAYDYLRFKVRKTARNETVANNSYQLLTEINKLPVIRFSEPLTPVQPEQGHKSGMLGLSAGRSDRSDYADVEFRLSFHELEDNLWGYMPGSAINMGRFVGRKAESGIFQLQKFDVIDIDSLSPRDDFFKPISWRSSVGFERYRTLEKDQGVMQVNGGGGLTYSPFNQTLVYVLGTGRMEYNESFSKNWQIAAGVATGLLYLTDTGTIHVGLDGYKFFNGYYRNRVFATYQWAISKDIGLQVTASHHKYSDIEFDEASLSIKRYF